MHKIWTYLLALIVAILAVPVVGATPKVHAFSSEVTYRVITNIASGEYIKIELKAEGTGLHALLRKSDPNNLRFTNRGRWRVVAQHVESGQTYSWDWIPYDGAGNNYQYSYMIWPANYLPNGVTQYWIELQSENDWDHIKTSGRAVAETICPTNWNTGLQECS